jgi:hypothetical protein
MRTNYARNGRVQTRTRRLLIVRGELTTGELARLIYPARRIQNWHLRQIRESASKYAVEVRRRLSPGVPIVWMLRAPDE